MERSEPALVPEWLRSAGSVAGAGSSAQQFASSSAHTGNFDVLFFFFCILYVLMLLFDLI